LRLAGASFYGSGTSEFLCSLKLFHLESNQMLPLPGFKSHSFPVVALSHEKLDGVVN
jgi:hypothetical protein